MADPLEVNGPAARSAGPEPARLMIVGLGNPMMADDGIGYEVLRLLEQRVLPNHVRLAAIDDDVLSLMHLWQGESAIWLVDALSGRRPAGTLSVYEHEEVLGLPAWGVSVHHASLGEGLRWLLHALPELATVEFRLFAVEVGTVAPGKALSRVAHRAIANLVEELARGASDPAWSTRAPGSLARPTTSS